MLGRDSVDGLQKKCRSCSALNATEIGAWVDSSADSCSHASLWRLIIVTRCRLNFGTIEHYSIQIAQAECTQYNPKGHHVLLPWNPTAILLHGTFLIKQEEKTHIVALPPTVVIISHRAVWWNWPLI